MTTKKKTSKSTNNRTKLGSYLLRGGEPEGKIDLLISLTSMKSETTIKNLKRYYCQGYDVPTLVEIFGVSQSNFNRDASKLEDVAGKMEELYVYKVNEKNQKSEVN